MSLPTKIEVYKAREAWWWRAYHSGGEIERSPESYFSSMTAKAIARMCYPGAMILVLKCKTCHN